MSKYILLYIFPLNILATQETTYSFIDEKTMKDLKDQLNIPTTNSTNNELELSKSEPQENKPNHTTNINQNEEKKENLKKKNSITFISNSKNQICFFIILFALILLIAFIVVIAMEAVLAKAIGVIIITFMAVLISMCIYKYFKMTFLN